MVLAEAAPEGAKNATLLQGEEAQGASKEATKVEVPEAKRQKCENYGQRKKVEKSMAEMELNGKFEKPKKADFRARAHCNPLNTWNWPTPKTPNHVDWSKHYPELCQRDVNKAEVEKKAPAELYLNTQKFPISYPEEELPADHVGRSIRGPDFLDVGCGFGGLTIALAEAFPTKVALGLEIREQVTEYVGRKIVYLRHAHANGSEVSAEAERAALGEKPQEEEEAGEAKECQEEYNDGNGKGPEEKTMAEREQDVAQRKENEGSPLEKDEETELSSEQKTQQHHFHNAGVFRTNVMKTLNNYISDHSLEKMFFCFPDPNFKKKTWKRRIINDEYLKMYARALKIGGRLYTVTDVLDLHNWMYGFLSKSAQFKEVAGTREEIEKNDKCVRLIKTTTEEGSKVTRLGRFGHAMHWAVFERVDREGEAAAAATE